MGISREELANAVRFLSIDAVEKANSGHPGMPMGMADIAQVLWGDFLQHNPLNPNWINRDRFILSNGHGSMLLYSLLHLTGYAVNINDLKNFRQLNSRTPGHPECKCLPGVETTTGPLGQGLANAVGMALAEKVLGAKFNRPNFNIVDHYTYCFVGDGCLMEGISHEVSSFAGTLGLEKLIVFWDDNKISIDGPLQNWFSDNTIDRFKAYNWHVIGDVDGHSPDAISKAIVEAQKNKTQPTLVCCKTIIGFGSPNLAGTANTHGAALGAAEVLSTRKNLNWNYEPFEIPSAIYTAWDSKVKGAALEAKWNELFSQYKKQHTDLALEFERRMKKEFPKELRATLDAAIEERAKLNEQNINSRNGIATRKASQNVLNVVTDMIPELFGGSADLSESNLTITKQSKIINKDNFNGNYIHYGVRELGMSAMMNGIALYGGFIPFGGTFLVFSDYAKSAMRLSCIMNQQVIYVLTHDSIGLGEDGPTHQPIEHLAMLRLMPHMSLWRPCDEVETFVAWREALLHKNGPTALVLTRQKTETETRNSAQIANIAKGGYILLTNNKNAKNGAIDLNIIATGSEVALAVHAANALAKDGLNVGVVSMPNCMVFDHQDLAYKNKVLPNNVPTVAIEAAAKDYWYKYVGPAGLIIGLSDFGTSAPAEQAFKALGFSVENVVAKIHTWIKQKKVETIKNTV